MDTPPIPPPLDWGALTAHQHVPQTGTGDWLTFWAGVDDVHGVLLAVIGSARSSCVVSMFGYADAEIDACIRAKCADPSVFVQLNLDSTQAAGKGEAAILAEWDHEAFATSVALGRSAHGAISHLKVAIIDGRHTITGSTNWSSGGENLQDNALYISRDPLVAADHRQRCDVIHDTMLQQMARARGHGGR